MPEVTRTGVIIHPDKTRVFYRPLDFMSRERATRMMSRVMSLSEGEVSDEMEHITHNFEGRHLRLHAFFLKRFEQMNSLLITDQPLSENRRLLIGAYFSQEYSLEAAALFNPSMVSHPDQSDLPEGSLRFVLTLRATGEGHVSSIVFRTGIVDAEGAVEIMPPTRYVTAPEEIPDPAYDKSLFLRKLHELGLSNTYCASTLDQLPDSFNFQQLNDCVSRTLRKNRFLTPEQQTAGQSILALARANYRIRFEPGLRLSERVIFPRSPNETHGIEDARFVSFREDDGTITYYGTYSAYDGHIVLPQLIETRDFLTFNISTLNGPEVQNKGMALFPRKVNGHYAMISRQDGENLFLMYSDMLHFWYEKKLIMRPTYPWEFLQLGNCGSPIETDAGWLLITHGVGAMRKYSIGAVLLDRDDPSKVIARLPEPLLSPNESEREGYVPNVVYSCGGLIHRERLVLPYAMSDSRTGFATVRVEDLIRDLLQHPTKGNR